MTTPVTVQMSFELCYDCAALWGYVDGRRSLAVCPYCAARKIEAVKKDRRAIERSNQALRGTITKMKFKGKS